MNQASATEKNAPGDESSRPFLLSVVVPVYNEQNTIEDVLTRLWELPLETEVIVVDDGSTDDTLEKLSELQTTYPFRLIAKPVNEGKGAALRSGFAEAAGDIIVVQDADLEYDPREIPDIIAPIVLGETNVCYGSRFLESRDETTRLHRACNQLLTKASNLLTGLELTDMETCYKAFHRDVIELVEIRQDRFGFEPEITAKVARAGHRIKEVPISYSARSYREGKKIGVADALNAIYCIVRYGVAD